MKIEISNRKKYGKYMKFYVGQYPKLPKSEKNSQEELNTVLSE